MPLLPTLPDGPGLIFVFSGPSGSGKTTLCNALLNTVPRAKRLVTCTSRAPRPGETDGVDYRFLTAAQFESGLAAGEFFEHALVHGNHYGSRRRDVIMLLDQRQDVVFNVDVQGAASIRKTAAAEPMLAGRLITIFVIPPPVAELRARLRGRSQDQPEEIEARLKAAAEEITHWKEFDYLLPSSSREADLERLLTIYHAERLRVRPGSKPPVGWEYKPA
ncbi:MAG TPA: guanylate kinase [Opitutales bacterium]|nr:guanylate kinase [Opitutales bacterium]